jgi:hypothetical protein
MVPRRGDQHLAQANATEAQNVNLYSGALRPLAEPTLTHAFLSPTDEGWKEDNPPEIEPQDPPPPDDSESCIIVAILVQPVSVQVAPGNPATFTVVVDSPVTGPVLYQWYEDGKVIPGAIYPALTIPDAEDAYGHTYFVYITNPCGQQISDTVHTYE